MLPEALQPYAKAVLPFVLSLLAAGIQWAVSGEYDKAELVTNLTGLASAFVTLLVPNAAAYEEHESEPVDGGRTTLGTEV